MIYWEFIEKEAACLDCGWVGVAKLYFTPEDKEVQHIDPCPNCVGGRLAMRIEADAEQWFGTYGTNGGVA